MIARGPCQPLPPTPTPGSPMTDPSRRQFVAWLGLSGSFAAAGWAVLERLQAEIRAEALAGDTPPLGFLTPEQAAAVDAATARILPTDELPGAREAHVLAFIDRALETIVPDAQEPFVEGLRQLEAKAAELFPDDGAFASLSETRQDDVLRAIEDTDFFEMLLDGTVTGFLCQQKHGGNFGGVGWRLIGLEYRPVYTPPFGYYDGRAASNDR